MSLRDSTVASRLAGKPESDVAYVDRCFMQRDKRFHDSASMHAGNPVASIVALHLRCSQRFPEFSSFRLCDAVSPDDCSNKPMCSSPFHRHLSRQETFLPFLTRPLRFSRLDQRHDLRNWNF